MRRLTLLLSLLMIAALRWIIGSAEAPIATEQRDAVLKTHVTVEAVNTDFKATPVTASTDEESGLGLPTSCFRQRLMQVHTQLTRPLPIDSTREFEFTEIGAGTVENLPPASDRASSASNNYL